MTIRPVSCDHMAWRPWYEQEIAGGRVVLESWVQLPERKEQLCGYIEDIRSLVLDGTIDVEYAKGLVGRMVKHFEKLEEQEPMEW